jgi:aryl-alcohol dehydrogenase-like predicted oxidoreductase
MKLGLGTVQFGTDYGISNQSGKTTPTEVAKILEFAAANGISCLDTAPAYGNSETVLGEILTLDHQFRIVTKTNKIAKSQITNDDVQLALDMFGQSLDRLQQKSVYGLLVHHPNDLLNEGGDRLMAGLESLKERGLVEKIGVSVYNRMEIDRLLDKYSIDLFQVPLNVFDQRLLSNGYLQSVKDMGIEIHVRSVFLQGILFMSENELPEHLSGFFLHLKKWRETIKSSNLSALQAAISFACNLLEVDRVLVGVNSLNQLSEIVNTSYHRSLDKDDITQLSIQDVKLIDPSLWNN